MQARGVEAIIAEIESRQPDDSGGVPWASACSVAADKVWVGESVENSNVAGNSDVRQRDRPCMGSSHKVRLSTTLDMGS